MIREISRAPNPRGRATRLPAFCLWVMFASICPPAMALTDSEPQGGRATQTLWVGPAGDPDCGHDNLADAITVATTGFFNPVTRVIIRVAGSSYSNQQLTVNFDSVPQPGSSELEEIWIVGGYQTCSDTGSPSDNSRTTLNANGGGGDDRVFRVFHEASDSDPAYRLVLKNLVLTGGVGGQASGGFKFHGGGLFIRGRPGKLSVHLNNSRVEENQTVLGSNGGGIHVETTGTEIFDPSLPNEPLLFLDNDSRVANNVADTTGVSDKAIGGGIHCVDEFEAGTNQFNQFHVMTGGALIRNNRADHGGGVAVSGCRVMLRAGGFWSFLIGSGNLFYTGGIIENRAPGGNGGGVLVTDGGLVEFSSDNHPDWGGPGNAAAWVYGNQAEFGGGIYASGEQTRLRAFDTWIDSNTAKVALTGTGRGGGVYATDRADVTLSAGLGLQQPCTPVRFPEPTRCNVLIDNVAEGSSGGGMHVADSANAVILNGYVQGNDVTGGTQGAAIRAAGSGSPSARIVLNNTLVSGNHATGNARIISVGVNGEAVLRYSTVAGNDISENSAVISAFAFGTSPTSILDIEGSIVWAETGTAIVASTGGTKARVYCSIGHTGLDEVNLIEASSDFYSVVSDPGFRDPENGNFRLAAGSPAINYCHSPAPLPGWDLDFNDRDIVFDGPVGTAENTPPNGRFDLGAYSLMSDLLFFDRFEN